MYDETVQAIEEGRLECGGKIRSSLNPAISARYIVPTFKKALNSIRTVFLFEQTDPLADPATGTEEQQREVEEFIYQKVSTVYKANTDILYLPPLRNLTHTLMNIISRIYAVIIPFMTLCAICWQIKQLNHDIRKRSFGLYSMLNIIMLRFILMALLRIFMISYVEVSSFTIGTYIMYLSIVHPLVIACGAVGFLITSIMNKYIIYKLTTA